jgi:deoxyribodipyrimidine photo-lyase
VIAPVPQIRVELCRDAAVNPGGRYVLYWMIASRRTTWNFALQRAVEWAHRLRKPLLVLEALRCDHRWACDRLHRFVLDGMLDNARRLRATGVLYYPFVERRVGEGKGLLAALAGEACLVVTDDFPCTFLPRMVAAAARQVSVRMEKVDSNGLLPLRAARVVFPSAFAFRRFLQHELHPHLEALPDPDPLSRVKLPPAGELPDEIVRRWPPASDRLLEGSADSLAGLPIDHTVRPVETRGGALAGHMSLVRFITQRLSHYAEHRNDPDENVCSGLSPYLHFGHVSAAAVFHEIAEREGWTPRKLSQEATGRKSGWWGMSASAEAFLDELVTWRELGYNLTWQRDDYDRFESLPDWARRTLEKHARDAREHIYGLAEFESARTHDPLWNAAQTQLVREGRIHPYLRMLWGKKILEWTHDPREALDIMIELNNKYALDGRNPNSYSGIFWVLGRYDRPWGPERPVFGAVRYMSSSNTARKVRLTEYLRRYAP